MIREIEDNLATQVAVDEKYEKVKVIKKSVPKVTEMKDGETIVYDDGSNIYRYYKVGGKLLKSGALTEV